MSYLISYDERGFIKLLYDGEANVRHLNEVLNQGISLALERNCFLVLSDVRTMRLNLSVMALFEIPIMQISKSRELNVPFYKYKRAVVVSADQIEKFKFFENVAVNRSHLVRVFVEMDEAVAWLLEK